MKDFRVDFEPLGKRGKSQRKESLLICARRLGIGLSSVCGGKGTCQTCKVRVLEGTVSPATSNEMRLLSSKELEAGWRLACQTYPASDCKLSVPPESMTTPQRIQLEGLETPIVPEPPVKLYPVRLGEPSLVDQRGDADRLLEALKQQHQLECSKVDVEVLRTLSPGLRSWEWKCHCAVRSKEIIAVCPEPVKLLGLAVDLGTTKIAGYLVDLVQGRVVGSKGVMNPQISYGEDVISRISMALKSAPQADELRKMVVESVNQLAAELCSETEARVDEILECVVVGNTAMHHLFLGLPVKQLARSPFIAAVSRALDVKARDLGLQFASGAYVHLLPNIAGFVGADHVAMLLAIQVLQNKTATLALDIGTNTEVSLIKNGNITSVSCASGPAFEGGHIKDGMRAAAGAIERVRIVDDIFQYETVDEARPIGICGSGVLDALAQLYKNGIIDKSGRILDNHPRVRSVENNREFVLVYEDERPEGPAVVLTQKDIRELQLAKAAIRSGIQILLEANGCSEEEIDEVVIAGAFGTYIDVGSAMTIGMLPSLPMERFRQVGNAAGIGARLALMSISKRAETQVIADRVHYIELASAPNFMETFIQANYIGQFER